VADHLRWHGHRDRADPSRLLPAPEVRHQGLRQRHQGLSRNPREDPMSPRTTRRTLLIGGLSAAAGALVGRPPALAAPLRPGRGPAATGPLPRVAALPHPPDRTAFEPHEQRFAAYLVTLAAMANDIDDSDTELRGYQAGG